MENLRLFETETQLNEWFKKGEYEVPTIGASQENENVIIADGDVAGAIAMYNKETQYIEYVMPPMLTKEKYPLDKYTPIGILVVPAYHNVYGDNSSSIISLVMMSCFTPDTGTTGVESMYWGMADSYIPELNDFFGVPILEINNNEITNNTTWNDTGSLPINYGTKYISCPHDDGLWYQNLYSCIPSPYLTGGNRNPMYYNDSVTFNAMSDFNGANNTKELCNYAVVQRDWRTTKEIWNYAEEGCAPAACSCWRFHTDGTKQGDWYLPACGEIGYLVARGKSITNAYEKLQTVYGNSLNMILLNLDMPMWTSTRYDSSNIRALYGAGAIELIDGWTELMTMAFLRVRDGQVVR